MTTFSIKPLAREDVRQHIVRIRGDRPDAASRFAAAVEEAFASPK